MNSMPLRLAAGPLRATQAPGLKKQGFAINLVPAG
jgi:hypothetical protein